LPAAWAPAPLPVVRAIFPVFPARAAGAAAAGAADAGAASGVLALRVVLAGFVEFASREAGEFDVLRLRLGFFATEVSSLCTSFCAYFRLRKAAATNVPRQTKWRRKEGRNAGRQAKDRGR
jgi:hypothetical protein